MTEESSAQYLERILRNAAKAIDPKDEWASKAAEFFAPHAHEQLTGHSSMHQCINEVTEALDSCSPEEIEGFLSAFSINLEKMASDLIDLDRQLALEQRFQISRVDPTGSFEPIISMMVSATLEKVPGADQLLGVILGHWIRSGNSIALSRFFKCANSARQNSSVQQVLRLALQYRHSNGIFPAKGEIRSIVRCRRREEEMDPSLHRWAHSMPDDRDSKEWKKLFCKAGLEWLSRGKPGRPSQNGGKSEK